MNYYPSSTIFSTTSLKKFRFNELLEAQNIADREHLIHKNESLDCDIQQIEDHIQQTYQISRRSQQNSIPLSAELIFLNEEIKKYKERINNITTRKKNFQEDSLKQIEEMKKKIKSLWSENQSLKEQTESLTKALAGGINELEFIKANLKAQIIDEKYGLQRI